MRHNKAGTSLGRFSAHRKALMQNLSVSLVEHEVIRTTVAKAKELRKAVEPMVTRAKSDSVSNRRLVFDRLRDRAAVTKLFNELGPRYASRPGGYVRIMRCGYRPGDKAPMAYIEFVGRPQSSATEPAAAAVAEQEPSA